MNQNPPSQRRRPGIPQAGPQPIVPTGVVMALVRQSQSRIVTITEMGSTLDEFIRKLDQGIQQLQLECTQLAGAMRQQDPSGGERVNQDLHRLALSLQGTLRAAAMNRESLAEAARGFGEHLNIERFQQGEMMRWMRGQRPTDFRTPQDAQNVTPPPPQQNPQLTQGSPPAGYFTQTPAGPDASASQVPAQYASPGSQQQLAPQIGQPGAPQMMPPTNVPGHYFGPMPGMPAGIPFQPAPMVPTAVPESLPVTTLPVQQVPTNPNQPTAMPTPIATVIYGSAEEARAAIPGPPAPVVMQPPVVTFASPEEAKNAIAQSHANNSPVASVPQVNGQLQKPPTVQ